MNYKIVFCDVDGTLLNSNHRMLKGTIKSINSLREQGIHFVIVTARGPSGIYPILRRYNFKCKMICYSGALILDEADKVLFSEGISKRNAKSVIDYLEGENLDCTWNVYSKDDWLVKDKKDSRVINEENIVEASATLGTVDDLKDDTDIGKILCMCNPKATDDIEQKLKKKFKELSIVRSSDILIEIMARGVTKGSSIKTLCDILNLSTGEAIAFGDYYNDVDMLKIVGKPFLMGNAPEELKISDFTLTSDNNSEGIYKALKELKMVE